MTSSNHGMSHGSRPRLTLDDGGCIVVSEGRASENCCTLHCNSGENLDAVRNTVRAQAILP
jgi:hypothetical protein